MGYSFPLHSAIGAATTLANILSGTAIEFLGDEVMLDVYGGAVIAGMTWSLTGFRGSDPGSQLIPTGSALGVESTAGLVKTNENFIASVSISAGTRLVLPVTNPGGASSVDFLFVVH